MAFYFSRTAQILLKRRGKVRNGSVFEKKLCSLPDISRCCFIYSFKQVVRNSLATFSHYEIGMLIFVSLCFNQCHFQSNHTFNIYANRDARFQWNCTKSPNGSTLRACFLPNLYIQLVDYELFITKVHGLLLSCYSFCTVIRQ